MRFHVVKDLGTPCILSARTIKALPIIIDLSNSTAFVGPAGFRVSLMASSDLQDLLEIGDGLVTHLKVQNKEPIAARISSRLTADRNSQQTIDITADGYYKGDAIFLPATTNPEGFHAAPGATLIKADRTAKVNVTNATDGNVTLAKGSVVGAFYPLTASTSGSAGQRTHLKGARPSLEGLSAQRDLAQIRGQLFEFIGHPQAAT